MQHSLAGGTISEKAQNGIFGTEIFLRKSQSGAGTYLGAHDTVTAEEVLLQSEEMHTAPFPLLQPVAFPYNSAIQLFAEMPLAIARP